ncbi:hypothetical protein D3C87_1258700 [compost metagenome]
MTSRAAVVIGKMSVIGLADHCVASDRKGCTSEGQPQIFVGLFLPAPRNSTLSDKA